MPELRPYQIRDEFIAALEGSLPPGEVIEAITDMAVPGTQIARTVVLTNRNLRFVGFQQRWRGPNANAVVSNVPVPRSEIAGLAVARVPSGVFRQASVTLQFTWPGGVERWTSTFEPAEALSRRIEQTQQARTVALSAGGVSVELERLASLAADGVLSSEEFERGKALFLGRPPEAREQAVLMLRQLHSLHKAGVLSESEFNMKKWDILVKV